MMVKENENPMREARVEKIVLNMGCGSRVPIEAAKSLLERISGSKAVVTISEKRTTFAGAPGRGRPLGCMVTLRGKKALELLNRLLQANDRKIPMESFDSTGNVAFGIREYIDVPGVEYDTKLGLVGFDVAISIERRGYRVKRKKLCKKVGKSHQLKPEDAMAFMEKAFGVKVVRKEVLEE